MPGQRAGCRSAFIPVSMPEYLEDRRLLSASGFKLVRELQDRVSEFGRPTVLVPSASRLAAGSAATSVSAAGSTAPLTSGFNIVITPGAGLQSNTAAMQAFDRAAAMWEARIADPITVYIEADLTAFGSQTIIGQTGSVQLQGSYGEVRGQMVTDASDESDDSIVASLPANASFLTASRQTYNGSATGTKANLKAMGFAGLDAQFGQTDGEITFNSQFSFDYDSSDGVTAGAMDFQTVAAHEIGHALGFISSVDTADYYARNRTRATISPAPLDLFRFENDVAGSDPASVVDFATLPRSLRPNVAAVTDDIAGWLGSAAENRMSTGAYTGDGRQASHWRDNDLSGSLIGILDPTLAVGQQWDISDADWRALDLIGWDISGQAVPPPPPAPNSNPTAVNDAADVGKDGVLTVSAPGVLANDIDSDGDTITVVPATGVTAAGSTYTINTDGSYSFDPSDAFAALGEGQSATETFSYTIDDGRGGQASASVAITVHGTAPGTGLHFSYFTDSSFQAMAFQGLDADGVINEDWGTGSPVSTAAKDNFAARWRGQLTVPTAGNYTFYAKVDDNVRLWIDDPSDAAGPMLIIRRWGTANTSEWKSAAVSLVPGRKYEIQIDFRELSGGASAALRWSAVDGPSSTTLVGKQLVPKANLFAYPPGQSPQIYADPYFADKKPNNDNTIIGQDNGSGGVASVGMQPSQTVPLFGSAELRDSGDDRRVVDYVMQ